MRRMSRLLGLEIEDVCEFRAIYVTLSLTEEMESIAVVNA